MSSGLAIERARFGLEVGRTNHQQDTSPPPPLAYQKSCKLSSSIPRVGVSKPTQITHPKPSPTQTNNVGRNAFGVVRNSPGLVQEQVECICSVKCVKYCARAARKTSYDDIAKLGPSWNFSLAENLKSLSLQDGPQSGIIFWIVTPPHSLRNQPVTSH